MTVLVLCGSHITEGYGPRNSTKGETMYTAEFFKRRREQFEKDIPTWPEWKLLQFLSESYWEEEEAAGRLGCPWTYSFSLYRLAAKQLDLLLGRSEEE